MKKLKKSTKLHKNFSIAKINPYPQIILNKLMQATILTIMVMILAK